MEADRFRDAETGHIIIVKGPDSLGNYVANCPSVPGCLGYGSTPIEAANSSAESIGPILSILKRRGRAISAPNMQITSRRSMEALENLDSTAVL